MIRPARSGTGRGLAAEGAARPWRRDGEGLLGSTATLTAGPVEQETERVPDTAAGEQQPGEQRPNKQVRPLVAVESAEIPESFRIDTPQIRVRYTAHPHTCAYTTKKQESSPVECVPPAFVRASIATRCQHEEGPLNRTSLNRSPVLTNRCHYQGGSCREGRGLCTLRSNEVMGNNHMRPPTPVDRMTDRHN